MPPPETNKKLTEREKDQIPTEILAKAAFEHNIPFILSTVTTGSN